MTMIKNAVDAHAHIIGPVDRYPLAGDRVYTPEMASLESYEALLERLGLERGVIVQPSFYGNDNRCTMDAVATMKDRGRAIVAVDPSMPAAELAALRKAGAVGIRVNHLQLGPLDEAQLASFQSLAKPHGLHLQLFQPPTVWRPMLPALLAASVPLVIDHLGTIPAAWGVEHPQFKALLELIDAGAWIKVSGFYRISTHPTYADVRPLVEAVVERAPNRCVWGSDWPHTQMDQLPNTDLLLELVKQWLSAEQLQRLLVDNPTQLYWG